MWLPVSLDTLVVTYCPLLSLFLPLLLSCTRTFSFSLSASVCPFGGTPRRMTLCIYLLRTDLLVLSRQLGWVGQQDRQTTGQALPSEKTNGQTDCHLGGTLGKGQKEREIFDWTVTDRKILSSGVSLTFNFCWDRINRSLFTFANRFLVGLAGWEVSAESDPAVGGSGPRLRGQTRKI